jgi:hypothetical protein
MSEKVSVKFNPDGWRIKITERSRGRMKFQLKLSQEEAEAFRGFSNAVKPDNIEMPDFIRSIFFAGVRALEEQLTENLVKHIEENRDEYEASGFTFSEEGKLEGVANESASGSVEVVE